MTSSDTFAALDATVLSYRQAEVAVETEDSERLGKTTASYGRGNVRVATGVNVEEAKRIIGALLGLPRL